uniref:ALA-interacting subunit n=1 Tax=Chromera velia CCMP2878 TaxID=1169474 RepID=A0A0G4GIR6_9ALVE|mmetsp:Transcript_36906/g.72581  ORF Transcript_36906/g.72581 Transcript_36906/m.72581 type:complete len:336 (+) Transcript_36906:205-1212(+)|eukprot:Cvel_22072.t1-p1 / transcript=Cvel_22072.t1 / gene=Cvel_22072 / organism=Chromera_velia_CCMP2878 / gene_product=ALA-interacting subunit 1, putative / transcript_product=ALA-interacting subunit 1, putative / location=Cvel_scaffold2133:1452-4931(-) / protein_length=335 / sequence_SO=supercontig / SO=protein_coding / is_pseudo=false
MAESSPSKKLPAKKGLLHAFKQQKLRAWQPVLTPRWVISVFLVTGAVLLGVGGILYASANSVKECVKDYSDPVSGQNSTFTNVTIKSSDCTGPDGSPSSLGSPVFVYYQLTNFYQNHRRYVKSRSDDQLRAGGQDVTDLSDCDPWEKNETSGKYFYPCGLIARSVFNDTFMLYKGDSEDQIGVDTSAEAITWETDRKEKFVQPDSFSDSTLTKIDPWLSTPDESELFPGGVSNGHFINWMRVAGLPSFRKLWGKIDSTVDLPVKVVVDNRYPVSSFGGSKKVVLSTASPLGGRNFFLAWCYFAAGGICVVLGLFFFGKQIRSPRALGDVNYLSWT